MFSFFRKTPLLILLLMSAYGFTALAFGRDPGLLRDPSADLLKRPALAAVFEKGVLQEMAREAFTGEEDADARAIAQTPASGKAASLDAAGKETDAADAADTQEKEAADASLKEEQGSSSEESEAAENEEKETPEEEAGEQDTSEEETEPAEPEEEEEPEEELDLTIPENAGTPVMGAVDYGNTGASYLLPAGFVFPDNTGTIFAPNGHYRYLTEVDERYFKDALFIGDSRTDGLRGYSGMQEFTSFLCRESVSIFNIHSRSMLYFRPQQGYTSAKLADVLAQQQFGKIYLSVGINEIGTPDASAYYEAVRILVEEIRQAQPDAIIYLQGIMHLSESLSRKSPYFTNRNIVERNIAVSTLANGRDIIYIDMNTAVCDESGNLRPELSNDGIHLKASAYVLWKDFIMQHAAVDDAMLQEMEEERLAEEKAAEEARLAEEKAAEEARLAGEKAAEEAGASEEDSTSEGEEASEGTAE